MSRHSLFTSEAVSRGHPDKVCDQISDAVLDEALARDINARVAVETLVKDQQVILAGELSLMGGRLDDADYERVVRSVIEDIGYTRDLGIGFDSAECRIANHVGMQSADIKQGVDRNPAADEEQGAGDQGIIFGYACDDNTDTWMPAPIHYAHELMRRHEQVRGAEGKDTLRPDAKCQVTFYYDENGSPMQVRTVVLSTQHSEEVSEPELHGLVRESIINPVIPERLRAKNFEVLINPTGRFVTGGPVGDCGVTGRKIIVDTYGGMARHGGGAFSGKDPSKVDRSAAYAARYVARHVVGGGFARRCEVQLAYAIGWPKPVSIRVDTFGTGEAYENRLQELLMAGEVFNLSPGGIVKMLGLLDEARGFRYQDTARHGHFGYPDGVFPWENLDRLDQLRGALGE